MTSPARPRGAALPRPLIYTLAVLALVIVGFAACKLRPQPIKDPFRTAAVEKRA